MPPLPTRPVIKLKALPPRSRAVDEHDKSLRRRAILDAGYRLIRPCCERLPSVNEIAEAAGLAKGTVYLYFKTKEGIFLAILSDLYESLLQDILQLVSESRDARTLTSSFLGRLSGFLREHPYFLPLASMANSIIEPNVPQADVVEFKQRLVDSLESVGTALNKIFPGLTPDEGARLLLHTHALLIGLWQMQNWPESLRSILQEPRFALVSPDFGRELEQAVRSLWTGALSEYAK